MIAGRHLAQFEHALGVLQAGQRFAGGEVQLAQVARQALEHFLRAGGAQMAGLQFDLRPGVAQQQVAAVAGVEATAGDRVELVIGAGNAQQEVPGEVHADQGDIQVPRQFQGDQSQRQRLPAAAQQYLWQQGDARLRRVVVLGEAQPAHAPQQPLRTLHVAVALRHIDPHLLQQAVEGWPNLRGRHLRLVFGGYPQCGLEQGGRLLGEAGKTGLARIHGVLRLTLRF
ncbi:hypothetical protein D3C81_965920 [compost metagenome]